MTLFSLNATRWLTGDLLWSSTVYYRDSEKSTINGDLNGVSDPRNNVKAYDDGDPNASSVNRTRTSQRGYGFSTQAALTSGNLSGPRQSGDRGGGYDRSSSDFRQRSAPNSAAGGAEAAKAGPPCGRE